MEDNVPTEEDSRTTQQQRRTTAFPPELAWVTDQDRKNFALGLDVDSNRKSKNYGQENLVAQTVTVK